MEASVDQEEQSLLPSSQSSLLSPVSELQQQKQHCMSSCQLGLLLLLLLALPFVAVLLVTYAPLSYGPLLSHASTLDPLPSCSLVNLNLTLSLLEYSSSIQTRHVHADCAHYQKTGRCVSNSVPTLAGSSPSAAFRPRWLVFRILTDEKGGAGGLSDRLKGLLSMLTLAALLGRAFAIEATELSTFRLTYERSAALEWVDYADIPEAVRAHKKRTLELWWINKHNVDIVSRHDTDWRAEWAAYDVVKIQANLNHFADIRENTHLLAPYRAFGFDASTDKGDLDMYWGCLHDFSLSYTPAVLAVLNPLLAAIERPPVLSWQDTLEVQRVQLATASAGRLQLPFTPTSAVASASSSSSSSPSSNSSSSSSSSSSASPVHRLYCAQIRMGSNGVINGSSGTLTSFEQDPAWFINKAKLVQILERLQSLVGDDRQVWADAHDGAAPAYSVFVTSDGDNWRSVLPANLSTATLLVVPGVTAHLDHLVDSTSKAQVLEAAVKVVVSHYLLGECDIAVVTGTGFGATSAWRTRNRDVHGQPFTNQAYVGRYQMRIRDVDIRPYEHVRGSHGWETDDQWRAVKPAIRAIIDREVYGDQHDLRYVLDPRRYGFRQASAALPVAPPRDPMSDGSRPLAERLKGRWLDD